MNEITDPLPASTEQAEPAQPEPRPPTSNQQPTTSNQHHHHPRPANRNPVASLLNSYRPLHHLLQRPTIPHPLRLDGAHLLVGDFLLVDKQGFGFDDAFDGSPDIFPAATIRRGDIIIFHFPVDPNTHLIKRVVGIPGDHLRLHDNHVYINGQPLTEPYAVYRPSPPTPSATPSPPRARRRPRHQPRLVDPHAHPHRPRRTHHSAGDYFVLGDNRNGSEDSRYWGFVPRANIVGKPLFIYLSLRLNENDPNEAPPTTQRSLLHFARWRRIFTIVH